MIQRIQSIWLLLAAVCALASLKISFYSGVMMTPDWVFIEVNGTYNIINTLLTVSIAITALITIFLFKDRKLQLRLIFVCILLELALMFNYEFTLRELDKGNYTIGSFLQLVVMAAFILAIKGIRKDNKIISESERLR